MHRPHNTNRRHFADLGTVTATFKKFQKELEKRLDFDLGKALKAAERRVYRFYGASAFQPHQGAREKLRRRIGGFAGLHDHWLNTHGRRVCSICDQGLTHEQVAKEREK